MTIEREIGDDGKPTGRIRAAQFFRDDKGRGPWRPRWSRCGRGAIARGTALPSTRVSMPFDTWSEAEARAAARSRAVVCAGKLGPRRVVIVDRPEP